MGPLEGESGPPGRDGLEHSLEHQRTPRFRQQTSDYVAKLRPVQMGVFISRHLAHADSTLDTCDSGRGLSGRRCPSKRGLSAAQVPITDDRLFCLRERFASLFLACGTRLAISRSSPPEVLV